MPDQEQFKDIIAQVRARASNPSTLHDMAQGLSPVPRIYPKATSEQIAAIEKELGFSLPPLLKRILAEIGNGGFGPGYGLIGVEGGYSDFGQGTLAELYQAFREPCMINGPTPWPDKVMPVCNWGCGIYSCIDCARPDFPVLVYDPDSHVLDDDNLQATLTNAEGQVIWAYDPQKDKSKAAPPSESSPREIGLIWHKSSFQKWISAWANGVDLWEEMQGLP